MSKPKSPFALTPQQIASTGGRARKKKLTRQQRSDIARAAANARWNRVKAERYPPGFAGRFIDAVSKVIDPDWDVFPVNTLGLTEPPQ